VAPTVLLGASRGRAAAVALSTRFASSPDGSSRLLGWVGPLAVYALALGLRLWRLGEPDRLAFDETYYAKDAWSLRHFGYVREYVESANKRIEAVRSRGCSPTSRRRSCTRRSASG
jgi:hypothetical protein